MQFALAEAYADELRSTAAQLARAHAEKIDPTLVKKKRGGSSVADHDIKVPSAWTELGVDANLVDAQQKSDDGSVQEKSSDSPAEDDEGSFAGR